MSIPGSASPLFLATAAAAAPAAAHQVDRSLRFNKDDSAYLSRNFSASNRKTWTWSGWVKRANSDSDHHLFVGDKASSESLSDSTFGRFYIASNGKLYFSGYSTVYRSTNALLRDFSAWYHLVLAVDTTQSTPDDRIKIYINGVQVAHTDFDTKNNPGEDDDLGFNTATPHTIGARSRSGTIAHYHDGYLAEIHFVDGTALAATDFGEEDSNKVWQPIDCKDNLTYSTNGFYLKFADNSSKDALGTDSSGNSNTFTVTNLAVAAGALTGSRGSNYDTESSTYSEYGTVSQASSLTLPMSNPSHYEGAALRLNSGGFKAEPTHSASTEFFMACWVKFDSLVSGNQMGVNIGGNYVYFEVRSSGDVKVRHVSPGSSGQSTSTPLSTNTWHHIALSRSGNTLTGFVDGTAVITATCGNATANQSVPANSEFNFFGQSGTNYNMSGYLLDAVVYVGAGRTSNYTVPSSPLITSSGGINDVAGMSSSNRIYASPMIVVGSGAEGIDSLLDTPTNYTAASANNGGNYATLNPLAKSTNVTLSNGNLDYTAPNASNTYGSALSTIGVSSGKWYAEYVWTSGSSNSHVGVATGDINFETWLGNNAGAYTYYANGLKYNNGTSASYGASYTNGDVIGVAFDADAGTLVFYKNGTSQGTAYTGLTSGPYFFGVGMGVAGQTATFNFGQRPFTYTPPTGHVSLCTQNLSESAYASIPDGSTAFDITLYTGTRANQVLTFGMQPDLVWAKNRSTNAYNNVLTDVVRGAQKVLWSNLTNGEDTRNSIIDWSYGTNQVQLGDYGQSSETGDDYVAWAWDAGTSTVSNTDGSITSSIRANASAGISIVSWTGRNGTVGHGLNNKPGLIITKIRNSSSIWPVQHSAIGTDILQLESNGRAASDGSNRFNATEATNSVFTVGTWWNSDSQGIAYCFAPVEGFSAFGKYTGNGSNDGPFVYTGMRPKVIIGKVVTNHDNDWFIYDTERESANRQDQTLYPNLDAKEDVGGYYFIDILSNGFKIRNNYSKINKSGSDYIYACFAENPFRQARAR